MSDFGYPPSRELELGQERSQLEDTLDELDREIEQLQQRAENDDVDEQTLQAKRQQYSDADSARDALVWAIEGDGREDGFDGWGGDATVTIQSYTASRRARVLDELNRSVVGEVGSNLVRNWIVAGSVTAAPWLDGGESLREQSEIAGQLPPGLLDWLDDQLSDLSQLTEGN